MTVTDADDYLWSNDDEDSTYTDISDEFHFEPTYEVKEKTTASGVHYTTYKITATDEEANKKIEVKIETVDEPEEEVVEKSSIKKHIKEIKSEKKSKSA